MTFTFDLRVILWGEIQSLSLLGAKELVHLLFTNLMQGTLLSKQQENICWTQKLWWSYYGLQSKLIY